MDNLSKIKRFSRCMYFLVTLSLAVLPIYYVFYWAFINHLPETLINANTEPVPLITNKLSGQLQLLGFLSCLLPLSALTYGLINIRKLFFFYKEGVIFSYDHVKLFKNTAKALVSWVVLSIIYESAKSVIFTFGNPPGTRVLKIGFSNAEITTLVVGGIVLVIAWVMDEGRILNEEKELTI